MRDTPEVPESEIVVYPAVKKDDLNALAAAVKGTSATLSSAREACEVADEVRNLAREANEGAEAAFQAAADRILRPS